MNKLSQFILAVEGYKANAVNKSSTWRPLTLAVGISNREYWTGDRGGTLVGELAPVYIVFTRRSLYTPPYTIHANTGHTL